MIHLNSYRIGAGVVALALTLLAASDGEWPPAADPHWDDGTNAVVNNPAAPGSGGFNTHLYLDRLEIVLPNDSPKYADWVTHSHAAPTGCSFPVWGGFQTDFALGDVDNDGVEDDIVITQPGEAVFAAEINYATGTLTPLWLWLTPYATGVLNSNPNHPSIASCHTTNRNNPLIWNLV